MKKCFIISSIGEQGSEIRKNADDALKYIIEPACSAKGYEAVRADKISDTGMITQTIIENILSDELAIVDITGRNANVFYELAIRHSYGLPVIQITRDDLNSIPFDVHNVRTIHYDLSASGAEEAKKTIISAIEGIEKGEKILNPVTAVSSILKLTAESSEKNATALSELLLKVNSIPERLEKLENNIGARFSQMLLAFGESFKASQSTAPFQSVQDVMMQKFFDTILTDPEKGILQVNNLLTVAKVLQENGLIKGDK